MEISWIYTKEYIEFFIYIWVRIDSAPAPEPEPTPIVHRVNIRTAKNKISFLYNIVILFKISFYSFCVHTECCCIDRKRISFSVSPICCSNELLPYNSFINKNSANNNAIILEIDFYYVCKRIIKYKNRRKGLVLFFVSSSALSHAGFEEERLLW